MSLKLAGIFYGFDFLNMQDLNVTYAEKVLMFRMSEPPAPYQTKVSHSP